MRKQTKHKQEYPLYSTEYNAGGPKDPQGKGAPEAVQTQCRISPPGKGKEIQNHRRNQPLGTEVEKQTPGIPAAGNQMRPVGGRENPNLPDISSARKICKESPCHKTCSKDYKYLIL